MNSIAPECTNLKHDYDKCFNEWFGERFLKGDIEPPSNCDNLFKKYQECIKHKLTDEQIKVSEHS